LFLLGGGLLAISFAATLFFLNTMERQNTFQDYIWPVGLAGLLVALIGLVLRVQVRRGGLAPQQDSDVGLFPPAANPRYRWDAGHGTPSTQAPERRQSARRV
jgi:hypothetical protein